MYLRVATHLRLSVHDIDGVVDAVARYGQMGVQLFFVASAYTLCLSWDRRREESRPVVNFYLRRLFRIAPAYYLLGILGYMALRAVEYHAVHGGIGLPDWYSVPAVASNLLFFHGLYPPGNNVIVPGGWSIGTEMLFYLSFPALAAACAALLRGRAAIVAFPFLALAAAAACIGYLDSRGYHVDNNNFMYFFIVNQAPVFALGIGLYLLHRDGPQSRFTAPVLLSAFAVFSAAAWWVGWIDTSRVGWTLLPFLSGLSFVALAELFRRRPALNHPLLCEIGKVSYSMYLIHFVFALELSEFLYRRLLAGWLPPSLSLLLCFLLSVALTYRAARISYLYLERPWIERGRRLILATSGTALRS